VDAEEVPRVTSSAVITPHIEEMVRAAVIRLCFADMRAASGLHFIYSTLELPAKLPLQLDNDE
jgi:hypothetical protein